MITIDNYQHFSFDLWLTLIKSNSEFKLKRAVLFKDFFHIQEDINTVHRVIKYYDDSCNSINEVTGGNIDTFEIYALILNQFKINYNLEILKDFYIETEKLFFDYPPEKINNDLHVLLNRVHSEGKSASILSNTGFIKGTTMRRFLNDLGILQYFKFQIFSDEVNFSKPNDEIFKIMLSNIDENIPLDKIIHIGDNFNADYKSAINFGINAYLVKNEI